MKTEINEKIIKGVVDKAEELNDLSNTYLPNEIKENTLRMRITRKTLENIIRWSIGGASNQDIIKNLELTEKEYKTLISISPSFVYCLQKGEELAKIYLVSNAWQIAVGGRVCHKQVLQTVREYNEDGKIERSYQEPIDITYELPPDTKMSIYLLSHHIPQKYGDKIQDMENGRIKEFVDNLSDDDIAKMKEHAKMKEKEMEDLLNGDREDE